MYYPQKIDTWILGLILLSSIIVSEEQGPYRTGVTADSVPIDQNDLCTAQSHEPKPSASRRSSCQHESKQPAKHDKYMEKINQEAQWLALIEEAQTENESDTEHEDLIGAFAKLIENDLKPFSNGITKNMIDAGKNRGILYRIKNHKLYRSKECNFPARCSGIEHFILQIIDDLDDMEMIINVSDWPQVNAFLPNPYPVFSFSKNKEFADIMYPAWTFWEGGPAISIYPKGIGRWDLIRKQILETAKAIPWEKKDSKGFFRGSRTSAERDALILLSREEPDLVDAQYTKNQAWKSDKDTLGMPAAEEVRFEDHCKYKYLFNYRGVAASFRYKHLFLCNSLVFQVGSEWQEYYYPFLKPWYHYIPVDGLGTKEHIRSLLQFANSNDTNMKKIAKNGFLWVKKNLTMKTVTQYWIQLLSAYGRLMKYEISYAVEDLLQIT